MASKRQNQHPLPSSILFFKIILKMTIERGDLKIPNKFTRKYGGGLPNPVFLKSPDGCEWKVQWTKHDDEISFKEGWKDFATYYSLDHGHLVVFDYKESSYFEVRICDMSALEIVYPFHGTQDEHNNVNKIRDNPDEIFDEPAPYQKTRQKSPISCLQPCKKLRSGTSGDNGRSSNPQNMSKHVQVEYPFHDIQDEHDNSDQISDDSVEILDNSPPYQKTRKNSPMSFPQPCKKPRIGTCEYDQIQGNYSKEAHIEKSNFASANKELDETMDDTTECLQVEQEVLTSKIFEALNRATAFKSKTMNPSFMVVLKLTYVNGQSLYIPSQFAEKHLKGKEGDILLLVLDGKSWPVKYIFSKFSAGWKKFASENHLNVGDVCLFELTNGQSLKPKIFRVSEEPHSPPPSQVLGDGANGKDTVPVRILDVENATSGISLQPHPFVNAAQEEANEFVSENPFFAIKIKPTKRLDSRPRVPAGFVRKHLNSKHDLMLQFGKKLWPVKLVRFPNGCTSQLSRGWALFAKEIKLIGGDVCVFELINREDAVLRVWIFRGHS